MGRLLEFSEAAKLYGVTLNGVRTWMHRGKSQTAVKIEETYYIDEDEVKELITNMFLNKYERKLGSDHIIAYLDGIEIMARGTLHNEYLFNLSVDELRYICARLKRKIPRGRRLCYVIIGPIDDVTFERYVANKETFLLTTLSVKKILETIEESN